MAHFYIFTNSPGEVFSWVSPICDALGKAYPNANIHVFLTPCQYATGEEARVCQSFTKVSKVHAPMETLRHAWLGTTHEPGVVFFLGGDPIHAKRFSKKTNSRLLGYSENSISPSGFDALTIRSLGADLMAEGIVLTPNHLRKGVVLLPGSRPEHLDVALPLMIQLSQTISDITIMLSPFTSPKKARDIQKEYPTHSVVVMRSINDLSRFKIALTIPGTNTMQLAYFSIPFMMILPTHQSKILRLNGLMGLLLMVPILGPGLKYLACRVLGQKKRLYALPNQLLNKAVCPEVVGRFSIDLTRKKFEEFVNNSQLHHEISDKFKALAPTKSVMGDWLNWLKTNVNLS
ncbi:MAG: hypothetical protein ISQ13_01285 [Candidatus Margulisbacteria bacterium]|nr:hypothetical protein [Candidatus Margulisiibacteriota bacterium]